MEIGRFMEISSLFDNWVRLGVLLRTYIVMMLLEQGGVFLLERLWGVSCLCLRNIGVLNFFECLCVYI